MPGLVVTGSGAEVVTGPVYGIPSNQKVARHC